MNNNKNKLIGIAVAGVGAATALTYKAAEKLGEAALDRKQPELVTKGKSLFSGSEAMEDILLQMNAAEEKLRNSQCELVETESFDGLKLVGHWHSCEHPKRIVIAMHGWRSSWASDFGLIADFWFENDCDVLFAEQRGQGNSGGDYMTFGLLERFDCRQWIDWVNERTGGNLPIYLGGVSMGATTILMTANLDFPDNVKGIVADCGFTSPKEIWKHVMENNMHLVYEGIPALFLEKICKEKLNLASDSFSTLDALADSKVPVMLVHGTDDHFVPVEMTYENYKACTSPKRLLIVPGAEHGLSYLLEKENYEMAIRRFWEDFDGYTREKESVQDGMI